MTLKLRGDKKLIRQFRKLGEATQSRILARAVKEGGKVVADKARAAAPSRPGGGRLKKGITQKTVRRGLTRAIEHIGWEKGIFYGRFQELGTKRHAAQPHIGAALKDNKTAVVSRIAGVLRRAIRRAI